jgi:hypothetical protein
MNKRQRERIERLLPNGLPRYLRIYDNGGETADRYTVVFTGNYRIRGLKRGERPQGQHPALCMSGSPTHPQGVCMWNEYSQPCDTYGEGGRGYKWPPAIGRKNHLGTRIDFDDLPVACQRIALKDYCELWDLPNPGLPIRKGDTVELKDSVQHHTCPEGRQNNRTAVIVSVYGEDNDQLMMERDLRGCLYWNKEDVRRTDARRT